MGAAQTRSPFGILRGERGNFKNGLAESFNPKAEISNRTPPARPISVFRFRITIFRLSAFKIFPFPSLDTAPDPLGKQRIHKKVFPVVPVEDVLRIQRLEGLLHGGGGSEPILL